MEDHRVVLPQPININSASRDQLMLLRGIGVTYAERIVEGQPYRTIEDLVSRRRIPLYIYTVIQNHITIEGKSCTANGECVSEAVDSMIG